MEGWYSWVKDFCIWRSVVFGSQVKAYEKTKFFLSIPTFSYTILIIVLGTLLMNITFVSFLDIFKPNVVKYLNITWVSILYFFLLVTWSVFLASFVMTNTVCFLVFKQGQSHLLQARILLQALYFIEIFISFRHVWIFFQFCFLIIF